MRGRARLRRYKLFHVLLRNRVHAQNRGSSFPELRKYKPRNGPWTTPENEAEDDGAGPGGVGGSRGDDVDEDDDTDDGRFSAAGDAPDLEDGNVAALTEESPKESHGAEGI